ncbi:MAG: hypothetical protein QM687_15135 [Ferruginibacter sp.]
MRNLLKIFILIVVPYLLKNEAQSQIQLKKFTILNFTTPIRSFPLQVFDICQAGQGKILYYQIVINQIRCLGFIWLDQFSNVVVHKVYADPYGRDIYCTRLMPTSNNSYSVALAAVRSPTTSPDHPLVITLDNSSGNLLSCEELTNAPGYYQESAFIPTDIVRKGNKYKILATGATPVCYDFDPATNIYSYTIYTDSDINRPQPIQLVDAHFVKSYHNSEALLTGDVTFFGILHEWDNANLITDRAFVYKEAGNTTGVYYDLGLNNSNISAIHINGEDAGPTYNIALQNQANLYVFESNNNLSTVNWTRFYSPSSNVTVGLYPENNHGTKAGFAGGVSPSVDYFPSRIVQPFTGPGYIRVDLNNGNLLNANYYDLNIANHLLDFMRSYTYDPNMDFTAIAGCATVMNNTDQSFYYMVDNSLTPSTCPTSINFTETSGSFTKTPRTLLRTASPTYTSVAVPLSSVTPNPITVQNLCFDVGGRISNSSVLTTEKTDNSELKIIPTNAQLNIQSEKNIIAVNVFNNIGQLIHQEKNIKTKNIKTKKLNHGLEKIVIVELFFSDQTSITRKIILL